MPEAFPRTGAERILFSTSPRAVKGETRVAFDVARSTVSTTTDRMSVVFAASIDVNAPRYLV